mmetsp:Transcript_55435/g.135808  ORF Transcript_55435/g.135808 Transcript_55435/m.135808 type:complete len:267 (-) Transcript_55435:176-976(-)
MASVLIHEQEVPVTFEEPSFADRFDKVKTFSGFKEWVNRMDPGFVIKGITIQSLDMFGPNVVGSVKMKVDAMDRHGTGLPGIVLLRGAVVGMMVVITCDDDNKQYTVLSVQPRVQTGRFMLPELPTGFLEDSGDFSGLIAKEIEDKLGLRMTSKDLVDLTEMSFGQNWQGVYTSASGCDESVRIYMYRTRMPRNRLDVLENQCTGVLEDGETIKLHVLPLFELWRCPDVKALAALCIFENLVARRELTVSGQAPKLPPAAQSGAQK